MFTLIADLCLLLLLKASITIRKSKNNGTTNQIILKPQTRGECLSGLKRCKLIGGFLVQIRLGTLPGIGTPPRYETPGDLKVKT